MKDKEAAAVRDRTLRIANGREESWLRKGARSNPGCLFYDWRKVGEDKSLAAEQLEAARATSLGSNNSPLRTDYDSRLVGMSQPGPTNEPLR